MLILRNQIWLRFLQATFEKSSIARRFSQREFMSRVCQRGPNVDPYFHIPIAWGQWFSGTALFLITKDGVQTN